ncbi:MAG: N-6 DNA methylase [Thermoplasmata archaeon]|jgi:methylase of polypeptide subunit release factors
MSSEEMFPSPMKPDKFNEFLKNYIDGIRQKHGELNKRAYFKSNILEILFNISPDYIEFESQRNDLYVTGILFETKDTLDDRSIKEGLNELKKYLKGRKDVIKCVLTDGIKFFEYNVDDIKNYEENKIINPVKSFDLSIQYTLDKIMDHFENLYELLFIPRGKLPVEMNIIVPRILKLINQEIKNIEMLDPGVKYEAWKKYVATVLGSESETSKELYMKQSLLYYVAVLISAKILRIDVDVKQILDGTGFLAKGILNFVEKDNFFDFIPYDHKAIRDILNELNLYDFTDVKNDFFRLLYEDLILPSNRHDLGEFYTPEWLAKILVDELVTKDNIVLDPACGSGTFLKLALMKKKELGSKNIESQVIGFDINPIAVVISKANYITEVQDAKIIPIFLADSLMPNWLDLSQSSDNTQQKLDTKVDINFDEIIKGYGKVSFDYGNRNIQQMDEYLMKMKANIDNYIINNDESIPNELMDNKELVEKLREIVKDGKNHIWFYILRNIYNPYYYRKKVDVVIGNPPWLTFRDIKNTARQDMLNTLYKNYNLKSGAENKTQQDMAGFFIVRSQEYLKNSEGKIGFVLTRSIFNGSQYNGLRRGEWNFNLKFLKIWDISDKVNPFRKPSCMVMFGSGNSNEIDGYVIDADKKIKKKEIFDKKPDLNINPTKFYFNITENYSSISQIKIDFTLSSPYKKLFHNGATIFPRPYFFIEINEEAKYAYKINTSKKYTINKNKRRSKGNFNFFFDNFNALKDLVYKVINGENIDHFSYNTQYVILPLYNGEFVFQKEIKDNGYAFKLGQFQTDFNDFEYIRIKKPLLESYLDKFNEMEKDWERHRGDKFIINKEGSRAMSVWDNLNYGNKLMSQNLNYEYLVVYNASGKRIRSAVIEEERIIIGDSAFYAYFNSREEAYYISAVLNSSSLLKILKDSGILSERHIHKKPFDIYIPKYGDQKYIDIQKTISKIAEEITYEKKKGENADLDLIKKKMVELDNLVKKLLS